MTFLSSARLRPAVLGLALGALAGAGLPALVAPVTAGDPVLADRWSAGTGREPFRKILVVAITRNAPARRHYEDLFVSQIRGREEQGITSYPIVPDLEHPGDREKILETLFAGGVDGVITARAVSLDDRKEEEWAKAWRQEVESTVAIRPYVSEALQNLHPDAKLLGIEFALWDVQTGQRLWAGRSVPVKIKKLRKYANLLVQDVMTQLIFEDRL